MLSYTIKRIFYSVWILFGIIIVTFVLFRMTAGDPAATLLGKKTTPEELEKMRDYLGSGKPLFFGNWKKTETYTSADFSNSRTEFNGVTLTQCVPSQDGILVPQGASVVWKKFFNPDCPVLLTVVVKQGIPCLNGQPMVKTGLVFELELQDAPEQLAVTSGDSSVPLVIVSAECRKKNPHWYDTQAFDAFKEIVTFQKKPPYVSFFNFGNTLLTNEPICRKLMHGIIPSLSIMIPIFIGELFFGIILAMISCAFHDTILDRTIVVFSVAGMSISYLVLIIAGQWYLAYYLNLFPVWGYDSVHCFFLPVILGIISGTGSGVRFYRTVFIEEIRKEYLRTATAKGVSSFRLYGLHLLRNAMIPILTRASTVLPFLFTGSLLLESYFGIPGLGYEGVDALNNSDLGMLKALVLFGAIMFVAVNLVTDLLYAWADPRIRIER